METPKYPESSSKVRALSHFGNSHFEHSAEVKKKLALISEIAHFYLKTALKSE